ncbi:MAG: hypothetical protein HQ553_17335, partial [Chloroflexi bacterium]|nr:hypothetical protein [Chloroflexota bacterium]
MMKRIRFGAVKRTVLHLLLVVIVASLGAAAIPKSASAGVQSAFSTPALVDSGGTVQTSSGDYWILKSTYGNEVTHWTETILGSATIDGVPCYVVETTFDKLPVRIMPAPYWLTVIIQQGALTVRGDSDNDLRYTYHIANVPAVGGLVSYERFYENHSGAHGNPLSFGQSWTYQVRTQSNVAMVNSTVGVTAVVADSLETITVPAGTFECYKVVGTVSGGAGTITEWWDSTGLFDLAPVKTLDTANFSGVQLFELEECSFCGGGPTTYNLNTASSAGGSVTDPGEG